MADMSGGVIASESVQDVGDVKHKERKEEVEEEVEVNSQRSQHYQQCIAAAIAASRSFPLAS